LWQKYFFYIHEMAFNIKDNLSCKKFAREKFFPELIFFSNFKR